MLVADLAKPDDELVRRGDEPALALDGLEDDRSDVLGSDECQERVAQRSECVGSRGAAIGVRERDAIDLGRERAETGLVRMGLRGESQREHRPAVERALECDHGVTAGVRASELDGVLDRLGACVEEGRLGGAGERREREQPFGQLRVHLVRHDSEVRVRELLELLLGSGDHVRMRMADVQTADATGEVDEDVAVDVDDRGPVGLGRDDGKGDRKRGGDARCEPVEHRA